MNKLNPQIYKLLETFLSTKYQGQTQSQNQAKFSGGHNKEDTESGGSEIADSGSNDIWLRGRSGNCCCPSRCREPWPWENKKTIIDNKINCGCCKPHGRPPMDGENENGEEFRDAQRHDEDAAPEIGQENGNSPARPEEPDFHHEGGEEHCKPIDKDKKIIIENIVHCGCQKPHDGPDGDARESAFAYLYFLFVGGATVAAGEDVPFNAADPVKNIIFSAPQAAIQKAGNYKIYYGISGGAITGPAQLALTVNSVPQAKTFIPVLTTAGEYSGDTILTLNENDILTLRNVPGGGDITLAAYSSVGAQLTISYLD